MTQFIEFNNTSSCILFPYIEHQSLEAEYHSQQTNTDIILCGR